MVEGCSFGKMLGVGKQPCALCSLPCLLWLCTKRPQWLMFGIVRGKRGVGGWWWAPRFIRMFNDWEVERFLLILHNKKVLHTLEDKLFLREAKGGLFLVKFAY